MNVRHFIKEEYLPRFKSDISADWLGSDLVRILTEDLIFKKKRKIKEDGTKIKAIECWQFLFMTSKIEINETDSKPA